MAYHIARPAIVLLAAGESSRLGRPKQLLACEGEPLLSKAVLAALHTGSIPVVVVLGAHADSLRPILTDPRALILVNPHWPKGMATSLHCGLTEANLRYPDTDGVIVMVCDQPGLDASVLRALIDLQRQSGMPAAAACYGGHLGTPAILHRSLFPDLLTLQGDRGARHLLREMQERVAVLPFEAGALDIDTEADVLRWTSANTPQT